MKKKYLIEKFGHLSPELFFFFFLMQIVLINKLHCWRKERKMFIKEIISKVCINLGFCRAWFIACLLISSLVRDLAWEERSVCGAEKKP